MAVLGRALRVGFFLVLFTGLGILPANGETLVADTRAPAPIDGAASPTPPDGLSAQEWRSMQELVAEAEYQFTWQVSDGIPAYRAPNRAHDLSLSLTAEGLHAARYGPDGEPLWDWGLSLVNYGGQTVAAVDRADLRGLRERVEYHRSRDVVEWYANGTDGVEHGLTLAAPPAGMDSSTVELTFALRGSLTPELDDSGGTLHLVGANGKTVLVYDQLAVYDAAGRALPAHMRLSGGVQSADLQLVVDAAGATYPLTVDPLLHSQSGKLIASDAADNDYYGYSVDISGDTAVVGAYTEDGAGINRGAAYVLARNESRGTSWGEVIKITASDAADEDYFGISVAISGDAGTIVVGAHAEDTASMILGAAYVFARNEGGADNWGQVEKLTITGADSYANFGMSVDIDEDAGVIVVGAYRLDGAGSWRGAAYVFCRNEGGVDNWGLVKTLTAGTDVEDYAWFGYSVAISHDTVVVGAYGEEGAGTDRGAAYVFQRNQGGADNWEQVQKLVASDPADADHFGFSVAISGDTIVAGAYSKDGAGTDRGAAYVFERNKGGVDHWGQVKKLTASDAVDGDYFGRAVAISIDTVVVGAYEEDGAGTDRGAAYVFQRNEGGADHWGQVEKLVASDAADGDNFARSVAISNNTILVGAYREDGAGSDRGAAYLFRLDGGQWLEIAHPTASDPEDDDQFGMSVAISGDTAIVGAHWEDGAGTDRGAAYIFERNWDVADSWGQVTKIVCFDCVSEDYFGRSVAISGDTAVVGAWGAGSGAAYVYERNWDMYTPNTPEADNWGEVAKLTAGADSVSGDYFGFSVAISGDTVIVGARGISDSRGAAYIFERNYNPSTPTTPDADNWGERKKLTASSVSGDYFGYAVAISGDTAIVGAFAEDGAGSNRGAAYIYARNYDPVTPSTPIADNWGQVKKLTASDAEDGDNFGISVAISGDTAIVGAYKKNLGLFMVYDRGAAYIYVRNYNPSTPTTPDADNWGEVQRVTASPYAENYAYFGRSVSISGDTAVVGAYAEDGADSDRGAAYVFERNQGGIDNWGQVIRLTASDAGDGDYFGFSVAISGDTIIVGAYGKDGTGGSDRGAAYIFPLSEYRVYLPLVLRNY